MDVREMRLSLDRLGKTRLNRSETEDGRERRPGGEEMDSKNKMGDFSTKH
jgi:hypothetical protein